MSHPANPPPYDVIYTHGVPMQPVQTQPQAHVMIHVPHQPVYRGTNTMSIEPSTVICPSCNYMISTRTEIRPSFRTHTCAFCICILGLWPCCLIPYCVPSCNNVDHYCPKCNAYIGGYTN